MCGLGSAIERGWENVGNWLVTHGGENGIGQLFNDFSSADESDDVRKPETRLSDLNSLEYLRRDITVPDDDFNAYTMDAAKADWSPADPDIAPGFTTVWKQIAQNLISAKQTFNNALNNLENGPERWSGATHDAAMKNVAASLVEPDAAAQGADAMSILVDAFSRTINTSRSEIMDRAGKYDGDMATYGAYPEAVEEIRTEYAGIVQSIMRQAYTPAVHDIASKNPGFTSGKLNDVGPLPGGGTPGVGGGGGGGGGRSTPGGAGMPAPPTFQGAQLDPAAIPRPSTPTPTVPELPTDALSGLTGAASDAAKQASGAAQEALDQALDAAKGLGSGGMPPEGVLGLGPNGLRGATPGGGSGGRGAGGGTAGGSSGGKPSNVPATQARTAAASTSALPRASLSSGSGGMGGGGAGAPAAGQRGGANDKEHKTSKALRRKKNGELVAGDAEAVVAVVGDDSKSADPADARPAQPS